jgi:SAM-dependent methyltransferase
MPSANPTERFSSRVDNYIRYRPSYPPQVLDILKLDCALASTWTIADIGSGTGVLSRLLLENGNRVFGVEPNPDMRQAGERLLQSYPDFVSVAGSAEATTLPAASVEMVTAAQAAHWFDPVRARREFVRILKPEGWTALIWNERKTDATPFLAAYENLLLTYGTDYQEVRHERTTADIDAFFSPSPFQSSLLPNYQDFDYAALQGRLLSSSYTPQEGDPRYEPMLRELRTIFDAHQKAGHVRVEYITQVYYGQLT